jgi:hypothetical protein
MTRLSRSDETLLNAAIRDLRNAPKVLGHGRADALRSAPFSAPIPQRMPALPQAHRHRRRHQVSQRFRRSGPCRVPRAQCPHWAGAYEAETRYAEREPRLPELLDSARRTVLVAHDNRCFRAFWCRTTSNDRLGDTHLQPWRTSHRKGPRRDWIRRSRSTGQDN